MQNSYILLLAVGMVQVIIIGNIDLSVGRVCAFVGVITSYSIHYTKLYDSLPHAATELPLNYFDERSYQKVSCYRTTLPAFSLSGGRRAILRFEGVMAAATVWVNGRSYNFV